MENPSITLLYHIIITTTLNIFFFLNYLYYKKYSKVGSQNFGHQIWFCTRLLITFVGLFVCLTIRPSVSLSVFPSATGRIHSMVQCLFDGFNLYLAQIQPIRWLKYHATLSGEKVKDIWVTYISKILAIRSLDLFVDQICLLLCCTG